MPVLSINNLTKTYGKVKALDGLNLEINAGEIYGILGPNGSGKTTTLGIILGILKSNSGSYKWFDGEYGTDHRKQIGAILETPNFYPYLNAIDNLDIVAHIKGVKNTNFEEILELVNLSHRKKSQFRTYSLGMKQRLAIGATLIGNPKVVIFDEPTNGLDPQGIAEVRNILKNVASTGRTVIMASHILDEVEKTCSHVAIIKNGVLLANGEVGRMLSTDITVEISAADNTLLLDLLAGLPWINHPQIIKDRVICSMNTDHTCEELNRLAFNKNIVLNHLQSKKQSLEEEFLQITKQSL